MELLRSDAETCLIELLEDYQEQAARYAAEADAGLHPESMRELASGWSICTAELAGYLRESGVLPKAADPEHAALTRHVDHFKAWFSAKDDVTALLEQMLAREAELEKRTEDALDQLDDPARAPLVSALQQTRLASQTLAKLK